MFHPPQAAIGLALLPMAWAADERARAERGGPAPRQREDDLSRYFPAGWRRATVPSWPVTKLSRATRVASLWRGSRLGRALRSAVRRVRGLVLGFPRG